MKIFAVVTFILILVLAWTQNRTFQNSTQVNTSNPVADESTDVQQKQGYQKSETLTNPRVSQGRQASSRTSGAKTQGATAVQRSAQATQKPARYSQTQTGRNMPGEIPYTQQRQAQNRQYTQQRQAQNRQYSQQRQAQNQRYSQQRQANEQRNSGYPDMPSSRPAYTAGASRQRSASRQQAGYQPHQGSTSGNRPPESVGSQQSSSESDGNQSEYRKESEPTNCIYRDGRVYCR